MEVWPLKVPTSSRVIVLLSFIVDVDVDVDVVDAVVVEINHLLIVRSKYETNDPSLSPDTEVMYSVNNWNGFDSITRVGVDAADDVGIDTLRFNDAMGLVSLCESSAR